jgi:hypothetical protein
MMATFNYVMHVFSDGVPGVVLAGVAIILMVIALVIQNSSLMLVAALFTFPFTYTMGSWRGIFLAIRLLPLLQLVSAYCISKKEMLIAIITPILPLLLLASSLLKVVVAQFPNR